MNLLSITYLLCLVIATSILGEYQNAPDGLLLILPPSNTVQGNTSFPLGVSDPTTKDIGLSMLYNISVTYPNGTNTMLVASSTDCQSFPGSSYWAYVNATQVGIYTASWNITYGYPTSVGNSTSCGSESSYQNCCGSGPLSYQTWIVNRTITVVEDDAGPGGIFPTLPTSVASTDLPSEPTGKALGSATPRVGVSCSRVWYFIALLLSALLLG